MIGFEVEVNGEKICLAGIGEFGVLTTIVSWVRTGAMVAEEGEHVSKLELQVGGLKETGSAGAHITWLNQDLVPGDVGCLLLTTTFVSAQTKAQSRDPESLRGLKGIRLVIGFGRAEAMDEAQRPVVLKLLQSDAKSKFLKAG